MSDVPSNKSFLRSSPEGQEIDRLRARLERAEELLRLAVLYEYGSDAWRETIDAYFRGD